MKLLFGTSRDSEVWNVKNVVFKLHFQMGKKSHYHNNKVCLYLLVSIFLFQQFELLV